MKKLWVIIFLLILTSRCKKDVPIVFDYRDNYTGKYSFTISIHGAYGTSYPPAVYIDTTYTDYGKIEKYEEDDSSLVIDIPTLYPFIVKIHKDNTLEGWYKNNGEGKFISTREMKYTWYTHIPSGGSTYTITGTKLE